MRRTASNIHEVMSVYCHLMEEIKARTDTAGRAMAGFFGMHPIFAYEFCYLQLRLSCELIASACVVAHGDLQIAQTGKMQNEDRAAVILKMLEEAHPNFYPRPTRQILDAAGNVECVTAITSGYLSKEELPKLYAKCGNEIHKGKVKKAGRPINQAVSFKEIGEWRSKK